MRLNDCELRAILGGHHSSVVPLNISQTMGNVDVGTIVLYPNVRVQGTIVSITSLAAPRAAKKTLARAEKAMMKKNLGEAETNLKTALAAYPNYAAAWYRLGQVYELSHRVTEAQDAFPRALQADGKFIYPYIELARLAAMDPKWQEAADLTSHALELDPVDLPVRIFAEFNGQLQSGQSGRGRGQRAQAGTAGHRASVPASAPHPCGRLPEKARFCRRGSAAARVSEVCTSGIECNAGALAAA